MYTIGIDIGSTTIKIAILSETNEVIGSAYERHFANIQETLHTLLKNAYQKLGNLSIHPVMTGSGGLHLSRHLNIPFVQETVAVTAALKKFAPLTDVAIELGGEAAKIICFDGVNAEQRLNGVCALGTGSFIDQMAALLQCDAAGLNAYAKNYRSLYAIAARCGIFAQSDIRLLLNDGATKEDLSASIFQAIVSQTISGLTYGKPIRGHVAFLGGPLHFLPELKKAFIRTLKIDEEQVIDTGLSHLYAAIGAALHGELHSEDDFTLLTIIDQLSGGIRTASEIERMDPLFTSKAEYNDFVKRHDAAKAKEKNLAAYQGDCYLGFDSGSATTKAALIAEDGSLLYSFYRNNDGNPVQTAITALKEIYEKMPAGARIARSCSTGYGEHLIKTAFLLDSGEAETVALHRAAAFFDPDVESILDIGEQDMKFIKIKNQAIHDVFLDEACSSCCGSFIETLAKSLNLSIQNFAKEALFAADPVDLGTCCTVFMGSKVKQAQKEGTGIADISAGLAYSVIKNALFKMIKLADASDLGDHVVVQGGTFYNNSVLRSFEKITGIQAIRPDIAGIMGAFGAALAAREQYANDRQPTTLLPVDKLRTFSFTSDRAKCKGCANFCRLTVAKFSGGRQSVSGNRCGRGLGLDKNKDGIPNLFAYQLERQFNYASLTPDEAKRGRVGIPRVLNIFENYPFWHTFFTALGYQVILSPNSDSRFYELGIASIPSESECYPAKLVHGHVKWLISQKVDFIFYPALFYEQNEYCPVVASYSENIKNNMEEIANGTVIFRNPFLSFTDLYTITQGLAREFSDIPAHALLHAAKLAWDEQNIANEDIKNKGEEVLAYLAETGRRGIVLAGYPYHLDPGINHGIPELIASYGLAVLTEDAVAHLAEPERPLSRLYAAASFVKHRNDLDLIQLSSYGCGLDAVTVDAVADILGHSGKIHTCLKIGETSKLGAADLRIRSLLSASAGNKQNEAEPNIISDAASDVAPDATPYPLFMPEMKQTHTILAPQMSPLHFSLIETAFNACGYKLVILPNDNLMEALLSGAYDLERTAVMMMQAGDGCRATNSVGFIRRALEKAGMPNVPVISLNLPGLENSPGMKVNAKLLMRIGYSIIFGDIFMRCIYRMRPYEELTGSVNELHAQWRAKCQRLLKRKHLGFFGFLAFRRMCRKIIRSFDRIKITGAMKPRVGIVGEILAMYAPAANHSLVELLESEGAEAQAPDMIDFLLYCLYNQIYKAEYLGTSKKAAFVCRLAIHMVEFVRSAATKAFRDSNHFTESDGIFKAARRAEPIVSLGNQSGTGWFLTGEMVRLIEEGVGNIICAQPLGCLPNHIVGKGVIKELRRRYQAATIVAIDYDCDASETSQRNQIQLMLLAEEAHE